MTIMEAMTRWRLTSSKFEISALKVQDRDLLQPRSDLLLFLCMTGALDEHGSTAKGMRCILPSEKAIPHFGP
jgi:hypothetical protein